jgi:hypothetical protein
VLWRPWERRIGPRQQEAGAVSVAYSNRIVTLDNYKVIYQVKSWQTRPTLPGQVQAARVPAWVASPFLTGDGPDRGRCAADCSPRALTEVMHGWPTALSVRGQASPSISSISSISGGTSAAARALGQPAQSVLPITAAWPPASSALPRDLPRNP